MTELLNLPNSGGSFTRDKDGKNLKQVQKPTADHPKGNRAREAEQPNQSPSDKKVVKEIPNGSV